VVGADGGGGKRWEDTNANTNVVGEDEPHCSNSSWCVFHQQRSSLFAHDLFPTEAEGDEKVEMMILDDKDPIKVSKDD